MEATVCNKPIKIMKLRFEDLSPCPLVMRSYKGSTIPELLISMLLITIITTYCSLNLHRLFLESGRAVEESKVRISRIQILYMLQRSFSSANKIYIDRAADKSSIITEQESSGTDNDIGDRLIIELADETITYRFLKDSIISDNGLIRASGYFPELKWNLKCDAATKSHRLTLTINDKNIASEYFIYARSTEYGNSS